MTPHSNRILTATVFAVLWAAGIMWRSPAIEPRTVTMAVIAAIIVGLVVYWLLDRFSGRSRG